MRTLSLTQQAHEYLLNIVPHATDEFSIKYPIRSLTYDYNTAIVTASLDPSSITALLSAGFTDPNTDAYTQYNRFTITNCQTQYNITAASFDNGLRFIVTFDRPLFIPVFQTITLQGFTPSNFNVTCRILEQTGASTFALEIPNVTTLYSLPITNLGFIYSYTEYRGLNGVKTLLSIDAVNNTITYYASPQNIVSTSAAIYDLGGTYGTGCGFIHNWHNNIHIGNHVEKFNDYAGQKQNFLFVSSNDFAIRPNQEKVNIMDVSERQDSRQGNIQRFIRTIYIDYLINVTNFAMASANEAMVSNNDNILYKLSGVPFYEISQANDNDTIECYFAKGSVNPLRGETSLLPIYRYEFSVVTTRSTQDLGAVIHETFGVEEIQANALAQNNNFIINPTLNT